MVDNANSTVLYFGCRTAIKGILYILKVEKTTTALGKIMDGQGHIVQLKKQGHGNKITQNFNIKY